MLTKPHPACCQCNNLLLLITDGDDDVAPQGKLQCDCCKRTFARKVYSKNQLDRQELAHCPACTGNHQKCRALERIAAPGPLVCRSCLQEKPASDFSSVQKSPLNDAIRRCRTCVDTKYIGHDKRTWRNLNVKAIKEKDVGKIMFAWKALKRKKADFEHHGANNPANAARLKKEEKALKYRELSLRKRDFEAYNKAKARLAANEKNSGKKSKTNQAMSANKRSATKVANATRFKKPRVEKQDA